MTQLKTLNLRVAALTHVGRRRQANEDCIAVGARIIHEPMEAPWVSAHALDQPCVCLVADGMGGHPAGDVASRVTVEHFGAGLAAAYADDATLHALFRDAHRTLFAAMDRHPELLGMGTTLAGLVADNDAVAAFNIGDSRVYRLRRGRFEQISVDDSVQVSTGLLFGRPQMRVLNQCLGGFPGKGNGDVTPHVARLPATDGSQYLICSDGLHDMLNDDAISACVEEDLSLTVGNLFEAAMAAGGIDNISILLARIERTATSEA